MKLVLIIFLIVLLAQIESLNNTKWVNNITIDCQNYIFFKEKDYVEYDCELDQKFFGEYEIRGDTLLLSQIKGEYDDNFPVGSTHREGKASYIYLLKSKKMELIGSSKGNCNSSIYTKM